MNDDSTPENLPANNNPPRGGERGGQFLHVENLNYRANDITELRRLAETNPELAKSLIDNQENQNVRTEVSYRLSLYIAGGLAALLITGGAYVLVSLGAIKAVIFVTVLIGVSHVLRAVLKGEFSETSWFGAFLKGNKNTPSDD